MKSGRGNDRGGWGGTMGRTTIISIVNTNVVVLSEYLPPELPLRGTIKGYCYYIVIRHLHCRRWGSYLFRIIHMFLLYHLMYVMIYLKRLNSVVIVCFLDNHFLRTTSRNNRAGTG